VLNTADDVGGNELYALKHISDRMLLSHVLLRSYCDIRDSFDSPKPAHQSWQYFSHASKLLARNRWIYFRTNIKQFHSYHIQIMLSFRLADRFKFGLLLLLLHTFAREGGFFQLNFYLFFSCLFEFDVFIRRWSLKIIPPLKPRRSGWRPSQVALWFFELFVGCHVKGLLFDPSSRIFVSSLDFAAAADTMTKFLKSLSIWRRASFYLGGVITPNDECVAVPLKGICNLSAL